MEESVACVIAPPPAAVYRPTYVLPTEEDVFRVQQAQMSVKVSYAPSVNGSARADGIEGEWSDININTNIDINIKRYKADDPSISEDQRIDQRK